MVSINKLGHVITNAHVVQNCKKITILANFIEKAKKNIVLNRSDGVYYKLIENH